MNKQETTEVMHLLADALRLLYDAAGLTVPDAFEPSVEAPRLLDAIKRATLEEACDRIGWPAEGEHWERTKWGNDLCATILGPYAPEAGNEQG